MNKLFILIAFLLFSICNAQKKVAVFTFFTNKTIDASSLNANADFVLKNTSLSENANFNLAPILRNYHQTFFNEYIKSLPLEIIKESTVLNNESYKKHTPNVNLTDKLNASRYEVIDGYKIIRNQGQTIAAKQMASIAKELGVDGIMFVSLSFSFMQTGVGKFGYVSVHAHTAIDIYTNEGKKALSIHENASSKKKAVLINGLPVIKPEKLLPMCENAVAQLMKDLNKKIEKAAKKVDRKL